MQTKIKTYLDYIPFLILVVCAGLLIRSVITSDIAFVPRHYAGLIFLAITAVLFLIRHLYGVLFLGLTLLLGLIGLLSYSPAITMVWLGKGDVELTFLKFQPIFLLWIVIYAVVSGRYFFGIASRKYWEEVRSKERY